MDVNKIIKDLENAIRFIKKLHSDNELNKNKAIEQYRQKWEILKEVEKKKRQLK